MIHWEEGEDDRGLAIWLRYIECSHWGLVLTGTLPRWNYGALVYEPIIS